MKLLRRLFIGSLVSYTAAQVSNTPTATPPPVTSTTSSASSTSTNNGLGGSKTNLLPPASIGGPPDVHLSVPTLGVKKIELDVNNLSANINLNAQVANLVSVNAGVALSIRKVNLTITDVGAELELNVRLGHLVDIVNRVFQSLDLNPLLITAINNVTTILETTVGAVEGLLGSIAQGDSKLNFLIDNLGNIVQQVVGVAGKAVNSIVGDFESNMTYTGKQQTLQNGLVQKTYEYTPLNALVNMVFNGMNQVVSATVVKQDPSKGGSGQQGKSGGANFAKAPGGGGGAANKPPVVISSSMGFKAALN